MAGGGVNGNMKYKKAAAHNVAINAAIHASRNSFFFLSFLIKYKVINSNGNDTNKMAITG